MKRQLAAGFAVSAVLAAVAACGGSGDSGGDGDTILIGGIAGTTGAYGTTGQAVFNGSQLAVDEINENGGVLGKKLRFDGQNDGANPTTASQLFNKMVSDGAVAIVGSPDAATTTVELSSQRKIPIIGAIDDCGLAVNPDGPDKPPAPWAFCTSLNTFAWGEAIGTYALANCTGLAVLHDPSFYGLGGLAGIKIAYDKAGKQLALDESITENWSTGATVGLKAEIRKIRESGADCVVVWLTPQDQASFIQEAKTEGANFTFFGNDETTADSTFADLAKDQADGMISAMLTRDVNPTPELTEFREKYKARFNKEATPFAELSYDAIYILKQAIEKANSTEPEALRDQLNKITEFPGLTGSLTFTPERHSTITTDQLTVVKFNAATKTWQAVSS
jgi:ABC-type branched-subunit amino acid transport system substrate-binding protein